MCTRAFRAGKPRIVNSLIYGTIPVYPDKRFFKAASPTGQAVFVKSALGWVTAYSQCAEFKADYKQRRASAKPAPLESKGTPGEQFAKYLAGQREGLETMKRNVAQMSPDLQKRMQSTVKQMEASVEQLAKDPIWLRQMEVK